MTDVRQLLTDYEHSYADPDGECAHDCDDHRGRQPTYLPNDDGELVNVGVGRPHTMTTFEIRDPTGRLIDATTRMTVDLREDR